MLLVQPDAGGAGNALQQQRSLPLVFTQLLDETLLEFGMIEQRQLFEDGRHRLARRLRQRIAAAVILFETIINNGLRYRLAAIATHGTRCCSNFYRQINAIRNRQAAVITGGFRHANKKGTEVPLGVNGGAKV
jgi:hypothetical protein